MKFVPTAISRKVASQALLAQKNAPSLLFGAGVVSMVGSTVLACRATLKLEETLRDIEREKHKAEDVKRHVESDEYNGDATYSDDEMRHDITIIMVRGVYQVVKLYAPSVILGGLGVVCLTKSHKILQDRNTALTAAYVAIDKAFSSYRERVVERYGEDVDREMRYGSEEVTVIDDATGKAVDMTVAAPGDPSGYARWFDEECGNWSAPPFEEYNWVWLRTQQNWANDMLRARGHLFLNEVYSMLGLSHTSQGSVVGWLYKRDNDRGDNYVDFGCWEPDGTKPMGFFNGREGGILLDFNVDGSIWDLIDQSVEQNS